MHKRFPRRFALPVSHLPIQDLPFTTAIRPEPERDEQHHLPARSLLSRALAFFQLNGVRLGLDVQPTAIELHHPEHFTNRFTPCELSQRLHLLWPFVYRA